MAGRQFKFFFTETSFFWHCALDRWSGIQFVAPSFKLCVPNLTLFHPLIFYYYSARNVQRQRRPMSIIVCFVRNKTLSHPSVEGWLSQTMYLLWKLFWGSPFINHTMWQVCVPCHHDGVVATKHRAIVDLDFIYHFVYCQELYITRSGPWRLTPLLMICNSLLRLHYLRHYLRVMTQNFLTITDRCLCCVLCQGTLKGSCTAGCSAS